MRREDGILSLFVTRRQQYSPTRRRKRQKTSVSPAISAHLASFLVEPYAALLTHLVRVLHQQTNKEQRKTEQQHYGEHDPAAGADLFHHVRGMRRAAVRTTILRRCVTHVGGTQVRVSPGRQGSCMAFRSWLMASVSSSSGWRNSL